MRRNQGDWSRIAQSDVVVDAAIGEDIGRLDTSARIELVDKPGRFFPRDTRGRLSRATRILGDH